MSESRWAGGSNGWTGGQYSLLRALFGAYLAVQFGLALAALIWPDAGGTAGTGWIQDRLAPARAVFPLTVGIACSIAFAAGWRDRLMAVLIFFSCNGLVLLGVFTAGLRLPFVGWMLLVHACLPRAPYGSVDARGRVDPRGGWRFPPLAFAGAWVLLSAGYFVSGAINLVGPGWIDGTALAGLLASPLARANPLRDALLAAPEWLLAAATWSGLALLLLFAPLAWLRRTRRWIWLVMLVAQLLLLVLFDFPGLGLGMLFLLAFTFDPAWVRPALPTTSDILFYDGSCGLCHRAVRFVLAEDRAGTAIRVAPLDSDTFATQIRPRIDGDPPDSLVVLTQAGAILFRSDAALHIGARFGGLWRVLAIAARIVPRPLRDFIYDRIAAVRLRLFAKPADACPILPPDLRARFLG